MIKPSKTEEKHRKLCGERVELYYKKVETYQKNCPYCDQPPSITTHECNCGKWEYNWLDNKYTYTPRKAML